MNKEIKYLFSFVIPYWRMILLLLLLITCTTILALSSPFFLKLILDTVIPNKNYTLLIQIIIALIGIYILKMGISISADYLTNILQNKIISSIKNQLFKNLLYLPLSYFETNKPGDIIQKVNHEVDKIHEFLSHSLIRLINNLFILISLIVVLCWLDSTLFLLTISVTPISIIINKKLAKKLKKFVQIVSAKEGDLFNFYFDRIRNIKLIKTSYTYQSENLEFKSKHNSILDDHKSIGLLTSFGRNLITFFISLGPLIVFAYGGYQVILQALTIGSLVAYIQYMNRIYAPVNDLSGLYVDYVRVKESARRIYPILSNSTNRDTNNKIIKIHSIDSIQIQQLSFSYDNTVNVLEGLNLNLQKRKNYAIVGSNGSGKTTLIKLLSKLYAMQDGSIILNQGIDLNQFSEQEWASKIAFISQEAALLYDTLRNNLLYGNIEATDDRIMQVLKRVGLDDFIRILPQGLDTKIGDGDDCINPSGGQIQMLILARLFLTKKEIIILDESTSAIDSEMEMHLLDQILEEYSDSIIIAISHKLNYIFKFDHVFFLHNGVISEQGHPIELFGRKGAFYTLFKDQLYLETKNS